MALVSMRAFKSFCPKVVDLRVMGGINPLGGVRFELGSWSRLAKFPPTVAGEIGFEGLTEIALSRD